jgi:DnaJ-class molecular chaperone
MGPIRKQQALLWSAVASASAAAGSMEMDIRTPATTITGVMMSPSSRSSRMILLPSRTSSGSAASTCCQNTVSILRGGGGGTEENEDSEDDPSRRQPPPTTTSSNSNPKESNSNNNKKKKRRHRHSNKHHDDKDDETSSSSTSSPPPQDKPGTASSSSSHPILQEILKEDDYYKILGLVTTDNNKTANITERAIQKAYRRRCVITHPDKTNGDRRAFDKVAEAYTVLSDKNQRAMYDRYGKAGLTDNYNNDNGSGMEFANMEDIMQWFRRGSGGGAANPFRHSRNKTMRYRLEVSLEDLYRGTRSKLTVGGGSGGDPFGSRFTGGQQNRNIAKEVVVDIPRGAQTGQRIRLSGEMDFDPNEAPGDVVFILQQRKHALFTRKGHDLAMQMTISLQEAVDGMERRIPHLSGEEVVIASARIGNGDDPVLIQNGDVHVLKGKGMPKNKQGSSFGDLYVQYQIALPAMKKNLAKNERDELCRLLNKLEGKRPAAKKMVQSGVQYSQPATAEDFGRASGTPEPLEPDEDEEEEFHGGMGNGFSQFRRGFHFSGAGTGWSPFGSYEQESAEVQCPQM